MGRHIEIIGLPGSGKTTFCEATLKRLARGVVVIHHRENGRLDRRLLSLYLRRRCSERTGGIRRRLGAFVRHAVPARVFGAGRTETAAFQAFVSRHVELTAWVLGHVAARAMGSAERALVVGRYFDSFAHFHLVQSVMRERDILLTDPGLIQRGIALLGYGTAQADRQALQEYLRLTPRPDVVISMQAPPAVCLERMRARGLPERLKGLSERQVAESLDTCQACLDAVEGCLRSQGVVVIEVEDSDSWPAALDRLSAILA